MDLDEYQAKTRNTASYPDAFSGTRAAINYTVVGLVGEAGEIANKWKKLLRGDYVGHSRMAIEDEIGDVLWYAARLAEELGTSLDVIAARNIAKLELRLKSGTIKGNGDDR